MSMKAKVCVSAIGSFILVCGASPQARALNGTSMGAGIAFTNTLGATDYGNIALGWAFTPITNITVTHLGFFDTFGDGLAASHGVGIYLTNSATPLVSGTVPSGTSGLLIGDGAQLNFSYYGGSWRYADVADTLLSSNQTYIVAAYAGGDGTPTAQSFAFESHPWLALGNTFFISSGTLVNPVIGGTQSVPVGNEYTSPNFLILPEPSCIVLLGLGGLLLKRRRQL